MTDDVFENAKPAHERHGFGALEVGEIAKCTCQERGEVKRLQNAVAAYGQYHNKRFRTLTRSNTLFIKRIS